MTETCERGGCEAPGRAYVVAGGVVHTGVVSCGSLSIATTRSRHNTDGWITLCTDHAMADLGVAIP